jgi:predicted nucleotidyltransferase
MGMKGFRIMMSKKDRKILNKFKARVHERFSDARIWAFGSRARGGATWESDFDLLIVLSKVDQTQCESGILIYVLCGARASCAGKKRNLEA